MTVSRETLQASRAGGVSRETFCRRPPVAFAVVLACLAALAVACGRPPGPHGWAPPQPVATDSLTLVPHKKTIYALPKGSADIVWQFPPRDRNTYRVSVAARAELRGQLARLELPASDQENLEQRIDELNVSGGTIETLTDAVAATSADESLTDEFKARVEAITATERRALTKVRALYGEIGVSEDGDTAFVPTYGGWLFALDVASGATQWVVDLDPMVGGVLVDGDALIVGTKGGTVYELDAADGSVNFTGKVDGEVWGTPARAADGEGFYVPTLEGSLYRLTDSFDERWRFDGADGAIAQTPVVEGDLVYAGAFDNKLYAIGANDGREVWSIEADNWFWGKPVVQDGTLYAASLDGNVYAVDAKSGEARWQQPFETGSQVRSGLVVGDEGLIVGSRDGFVHKVGLADGAPLGDPFDIHGRLEADLTADDDGNVYAISRNPVLWVIETKDSLSAEFFQLTD